MQNISGNWQRHQRTARASPLSPQVLVFALAIAALATLFILAGSAAPAEAADKVGRYGSKVIGINADGDKVPWRKAAGLRITLPNRDITHADIVIVAPGGEMYHPGVKYNHDDAMNKNPSKGQVKYVDGEMVMVKDVSESWKKIECQVLVNSTFNNSGAQGYAVQVEQGGTFDYQINPHYLQDLYGSGCIIGVAMVTYNNGDMISVYNPRLQGRGRMPTGKKWFHRPDPSHDVLKTRKGQPVYNKHQQLVVNGKRAIPYRADRNCNPGGPCPHPADVAMHNQSRKAVLAVTKRFFLK